MESGASTERMIAFLFPAFPNLHQTFVLWEVLALRRRGIEIALYSIRRPLDRTQQPEGAALQREVCYLPATLSPAGAGAPTWRCWRAPRGATSAPSLASCAAGGRTAPQAAPGSASRSAPTRRIASAR